jgi:hypothetical protein
VEEEETGEKQQSVLEEIKNKKLVEINIHLEEDKYD